MIQLGFEAEFFLIWELYHTVFEMAVKETDGFDFENAEKFISKQFENVVYIYSCWQPLYDQLLNISILYYYIFCWGFAIVFMWWYIAACG